VSYKYKKGAKVRIRKTKQVGTVTAIHPNPYTLSWLNWLVKPNYSVRLKGQQLINIYKQSELKAR
jgi:hypothetical protein